MGDNALPAGDTLVFRAPRGLAIAVGLIFSSASAFIAVSAWIIASREFSAPALAFAALVLLFCAPFLLLGLALLLGGRRTTVDRASGAARSEFCVLGRAVRTRTRALREFDGVLVERIVVRSRRGASTHFPVSLDGAGDDDFHVHSEATYVAARRTAELLAKFANLPLRDQTSPTPVERPADALDQPLRDCLRESAAGRAWPKPPRGLRIRWEQRDGEMVFHLPRFSFASALGQTAGLLFLAAFVGLVLGLGARGLWQGAGGWVLPAGIAAACLAALAVAVVFFSRRQEIRVSADAVKIVSHFPLIVLATTLSQDDLEELIVVGDELVFRTDSEERRVSGPLLNREAKWLRDALLVCIAGGRVPPVSE